MISVFLSYSTKDYFFAELAAIKLAEAKISMWRDKDALVAGKDWRQGIELGIANAQVILVALSNNSAESSYVTYEWAYAIGKGKPVIPLKLTECKVHPKLETIQHIDFSNAHDLPWELLIESIKEIEVDNDESIMALKEIAVVSSPDDLLVKSILAYLNQRGYQMASFDRIRRRIDEKLTDERLQEVIKNNPGIFRTAQLKGSKKGLAKLIP